MMQLSGSNIETGTGANELELQALLKQLVQSVAAHATLAPDAVAKLLAIAPSDLTDLALRSVPGGKPDLVGLQTFLEELVQVLAAMKALTGTVRAAAEWIRHARIREFDGAAPLRIIAAGRGRDVCRLIEMYDAGPAG